MGEASQTTFVGPSSPFPRSSQIISLPSLQLALSQTPIPTIQTYLVDKAREHKSRQTAEEAEDGYEFDPDDTVDNFEPAEEEEEESQKQAKEKDEIMKRMGDDEQKPTDRVSPSWSLSEGPSLAICLGRVGSSGDDSSL